MRKKTLAICLCMLMSLLTIMGCRRDPVIAKVGDVSILNSQYREIFDYYAASFGITDPTSADTQEQVTQLRDLIMESLIDDEIQLQKAKSLGLDQLTDVMKAEIDQQVQSTLDDLHSYCQSEALASDSTLTGDALEQKTQSLMNDYLKENGYSKEKIQTEYTESYIKNRLFEQSTADVKITDEQLQQTYQSHLAEIKDIYAEDASTFETDYSEGAAIYYIPEGYRRVKHILIALPDEIIQQIMDLRNDGNDKEANSVRDTALTSVKAKAEEALSKLLSDGSNFDEIMKTYTGDTASLNLPNGYAVSKKGQFTKEFIDGSFAIKKPMTLSGLIAGDYGYHIILYIETLKAGDVPFEKVKADIEAELLSPAKEEAYNALLDQWRKEISVTRYDDKIVYDKPKTTATPSASVTTPSAPTTSPAP